MVGFYSSKRAIMEIQPQEIILYTTRTGDCPFQKWLESLRDREARSRIRIRLARLEMGSFGDFKAVGEGVQELRMKYGPGYRLYFARDGQRIVVLLCGGDKKSQKQDIIKAKQYWIDFQEKEDADS